MSDFLQTFLLEYDLHESKFILFYRICDIKKVTLKGYKCDACLNISTISHTWKINISTRCLKKKKI